MRRRYTANQMHKALANGYVAGFRDARKGARHAETYWMHDDSIKVIDHYLDMDDAHEVVERSGGQRWTVRACTCVRENWGAGDPDYPCVSPWHVERPDGTTIGCASWAEALAIAREEAL